jgi:splicing factor 1
MSWRNQGITGSNNIPLGNRRRFGGDGDGDSHNGTESPYGDSGKRGRSPTRGPLALSFSANNTNATTADPAADGVKRRKKRNRWGDATDNKAAGLMGLPTAIQANMTSEQLEAYTLHLRIEEISQKLRINDVVPAEGDRYVCPSPNPISNLILTLPDHPRHRRNTTTLVAVSTPESFGIANVWKTSDTSSSKRP